MAVIVSKGIVVPSYAPPVGTTWLFEENGTFADMANGTGGSASGDIASAGSAPTGGYGNKSNKSQTYGNGGAGARGTDTPSAGKPGAVIITFTGVA